MSWQIDASCLARLCSFEDCNRHAAEMRDCLTPRRNAAWNENKLPLAPGRGGWRKGHFRLEWHESDGTDGPYWACVLYSTDIVRYYAGGVVAVNLTHDSPSTRSFFDAVSPTYTNWTRFKGYTFLVVYGGEKTLYHITSPRYESFIRISPEKKVLNPEDFVYRKNVADKERRAELKPLLVPMLQWYDAMTACGQSVLPVCAAAEFGDAEAVYDAILSGEAEDGDWRALCARMHRNRFRTWEFETWGHEAKWGPQHIKPLRRLILEGFWYHCKAFTSVRVVVPAGELP